MRDAQSGEQHVHPSLSLSFCSTDSFRPSRDSKLKKKGPGGSVAPAELLCFAKPSNSNSASFFSGPALSDSVMSGRNYTALRNTAPVKFSSCYYTFLSLDGILNEVLHQSVRWDFYFLFIIQYFLLGDSDAAVSTVASQQVGCGFDSHHLCVWGLHLPPAPEQLLSRYPGFLPQIILNQRYYECTWLVLLAHLIFEGSIFEFYFSSANIKKNAAGILRRAA